MSCVRIKRKVMGNVLLQHEGMPARLLYSKLLEVRFISLEILHASTALFGGYSASCVNLQEITAS